MVGSWSSWKKKSTGTGNEKKEQEPENVSDTEDTSINYSTKFGIVGLKHFDFVEKALYYKEPNHIIKQPKIRNADAEEKPEEGRIKLYGGYKKL